jgi:hypothetical protein
MQGYVPHRSAQRARLNYNESESKWTDEQNLQNDPQMKEFKRFLGKRSRSYRLADRNFMQSRGGIPELPHDIWRKIMPIHYPTLVAMRNVSRGLRDIVNAMIESFRPGVETIAALMTGRNIRRAMQTTRDSWPLLGRNRQYLTTDHIRQVRNIVEDEDLTVRQFIDAFPQIMLRTTRDQRQHNRTWV